MKKTILILSMVLMMTLGLTVVAASAVYAGQINRPLAKITHTISFA